MLIAVLALLGIDLVVIVVFVAFVVSRKRWVKRQPGAFAGSIRVTSGEVEGLKPKWRRGYGRWVRDILVWTKGPFLFRNDLVPADSVDEPRSAGPGVKRLGDHPVAIRVTTATSTVEVAAHGDDAEVLRGSFGKQARATVLPDSVPSGAALKAQAS